MRASSRFQRRGSCWLRPTVVGLLAALAVVVAPASAIEIAIRGGSCVPSSVVVQKQTRVTWVAAEEHLIVADDGSFAPVRIGKSEPGSVVFDRSTQSRSLGYHCSIHGERGSIELIASQPPAVETPAATEPSEVGEPTEKGLLDTLLQWVAALLGEGEAPASRDATRSEPAPLPEPVPAPMPPPARPRTAKVDTQRIARLEQKIANAERRISWLEDLNEDDQDHQFSTGDPYHSSNYHDFDKMKRRDDEIDRLEGDILRWTEEIIALENAGNPDFE